MSEEYLKWTKMHLNENYTNNSNCKKNAFETTILFWFYNKLHLKIK